MSTTKAARFLGFGLLALFSFLVFSSFFFFLFLFFSNSANNLTHPTAQENPFVVTSATDDGAGTTPGTFSYALTQASGSPGQPITITFNLTSSSIITFSGPLSPSLKSYVSVDGGACGTPPVVLNGDGVPGDGLVLEGTNFLQNLKVMRFAGRQIVAVSSGNRLACVIAHDPVPLNLFAWGFNFKSNLGDGTDTTRPLPVTVMRGEAMPASTKLIQISAGETHVLALGNDGKIYAWGNNTNGQLGTGETSNSSVPIAVSQGEIPTGTRIIQVSAGAFHSLALGDDGKVYAWGNNNFGQLGDGTAIQRLTPAPIVSGVISPGVKIIKISAGDLHNLALGDNGKVYSWGANNAGQLGNATDIDSTQPVNIEAGAIPAGVNFTQIAAGGRSSLVLGNDNKMYTWGDNTAGQLGDSTSSSNSFVPVLVRPGAIPTGVTITQITFGFAHAMVLGDDGKAYSWGLNSFGQLGDETLTNHRSPLAVVAGDIPSGVKVVQVSSGTQHSLALGDNGKIYAWGRNDTGQLGDGTLIGKLYPIEVKLGSAAGAFRQIECGSLFSFALDGAGAVGAGSITTLTKP